MFCGFSMRLPEFFADVFSIVFWLFLKRFHAVFEQFLRCFQAVFERFSHCLLDDFENVFWVLDEFLQGFLNAYAVGHYRGMMWLWGGMHPSIATTSRHSDNRDWRIVFELFCPCVMSYFHGSMKVGSMKVGSMKVGSRKGSIHRNRRLSRKKEKWNTSRKQCENYQKNGCENVINKTKNSEKTNGKLVTNTLTRRNKNLVHPFGSFW